MRRQDDVIKWLKRAKSNLTIAQSTIIDNNVFYEDLCFEAQQCVEKSFKALCIYYDINFPKTYSIGHLIDILENQGVKIPVYLKISSELTDYSVEARYPGDYEEVTKREYLKAVKIAFNVLTWVAKKVKVTL